MTALKYRMVLNLDTTVSCGVVASSWNPLNFFDLSFSVFELKIIGEVKEFKDLMIVLMI